MVKYARNDGKNNESWVKVLIFCTYYVLELLPRFACSDTAAITFSPKLVGSTTRKQVSLSLPRQFLVQEISGRKQFNRNRYLSLNR